MHNIERLRGAGIIPDDSEVIHDRCNTIMKSSSRDTVYRVSAESVLDDTPQDIAYSHRLSWQIAQNSNIVLSPLTPEPIIYDGVVVSQYPLADTEISRASTQEFANLLNEAANIAINSLIKIRELKVYDYVNDRLELSTDDEVARLRNWLKYYYQAHADMYAERIGDCETGFVHGDLHSNNIVRYEGELKLIDLDSASSGLPLYDVAAWNLRYLSGDDVRVDVQSVIDIMKGDEKWDAALYQGMVGWKALSSMSYLLLNYRNYPDFKKRIINIKRCIEDLCPISPPGDCI